MRKIIAVLGLIAGPLIAQPVYPPAVTPTQLADAISAATPEPCPPPMADTLVASAGTLDRCMPRADATRATQVQPVRGVTAADGTWTVTWPRPFSGPPTAATVVILGATTPHGCQPTTLTETGAAGFCYQFVTNTLPMLTAALPGLIVSAYRNPAAGLPVLVVGRQ